MPEEPPEPDDAPWPDDGRVLALPEGTLLPAADAGSDPDVAGLRDRVAATVLDQSRIDWYGVHVPVRRLRTEPTLRTVAELLAHCPRAPDGRLGSAPAPADRVVGHCRHAAVLLCGLLRSRGVPARVRAGFADYLDDTGGAWKAHWAVEHRGRHGWRRADAVLDDVHVGHLAIDFDPVDVPGDRFVPAPQMWHDLRAGAVVGEQLRAGLWVGPATAVAAVVRDLAALTGEVPLPWDVWGCMPRPASEPDGRVVQLVDEVAAATLDPAPGPVRDLAARPALALPGLVLDGRTQQMVRTGGRTRTSVAHTRRTSRGPGRPE